MELKDAQELDPAQGARLQQAPLPTKGTVRARKFLPVQLVKFGIFNDEGEVPRVVFVDARGNAMREGLVPLPHV